jgi:uncharacterized protein YfaP (DUF2135 family)
MRSRIFLCVLLFAARAAHGEEPLVLDAPRGGWVYSGIADRSSETAVAYPTPPIYRGAQSKRTAIQGWVPDQGEKRGPTTLVVNGNPMPLYIGADGRFARYYAFGSGSNGVEIRTPDGRSGRRVQFYEVNTDKAQAKLRVILSWDAPDAEVDMHVVTPDGQQAFWAQPVLNGGGGLDVDSVDGPGPEIFSTNAPVRGAYHVYVNYWGNLGPGGYHFDETNREKPVIVTRVTLVFDENSPRERRENFVVPLRKIGDLTLVKSFLY